MTDGTPVHGCTIDGQPAMPVLVADYNQLIARAVEAEARAERLAQNLSDADTEHLELARHNDQTCEAVQRRDTAETVVAQVHALYEQWVKGGPPPLGTSMSRWWDRRLVELHDALDPPAPAAAEAAVMPDPWQGGGRLAQSGVDTPGCDCGHDGMGPGWHQKACAWRSAAPDSPTPTPTTTQAADTTKEPS